MRDDVREVVVGQWWIWLRVIGEFGSIPVVLCTDCVRTGRRRRFCSWGYS